MIYFCVKFQRNPLFGVNLSFFAPWYHGNDRHFDFVQPLKSCHTPVDIPTKFDERNPNVFLNPPLFCFHGICGKVCPTDYNLSCSTRCGCCSYQVSSISVWRVTCYDHFCFFHFFCILAVLKKINP